MRAMVIENIGPISSDRDALTARDMPKPEAKAGEVRVRIHCCGICHTEMDEIEGRTAPPHLPCIPGHQVVGVVDQCGDGVDQLKPGDRVGIAWIFDSCGHCEYCKRGDDNLCPDFRATGRDIHGGYAEFMTVPASSAFLIPESLSDEQTAPLLCAGAIAYRSLRLADLQDGQTLGMMGFGASAHLMMKMISALLPNSPVYVFARHESERDFARELGAKWAGDIDEAVPEKLHAIIDTTPAWFPIIKSMEALRPGGRLVINAIRKEDRDKPALQDLDYPAHLWQEKEIKSVANVSRRDVREFLDLAARIQIKPELQSYPLEQANTALRELKFSPVRGAKVLICSETC